MKFLIGYWFGVVCIGMSYLILRNMNENNCHIKALQYSLVVLCMVFIAALTNLFVKD